MLFLADFHIHLFVLSSYSPQMHGGIGPANQTFRYEFYALKDKFASYDEISKARSEKEKA